MSNKNICDASIRVFKTLIALSKNDLNIYEILNIIKDCNNNFFTNETIYKYINTLKSLGIKIERKKDKYVLKEYPPYIELSENEILGLNLISKFDFPDTITTKNIQEFLFQIDKHLSEETKQKLNKIKLIKSKTLLSEKNIEKVQRIEKAMQEVLQCKIKLHNGELFTGVVKDLETTLNTTIVKISDSGKHYDIDLDNIIEIDLLTTKKAENIQTNSICFKLKNKLSSSYKMRIGERIIDRLKDGSILIANSTEAENTLLKRLLRYGVHCEVISPIDTRLKMKKLINEIYNLYEEEYIE